VGVAGVGRSSTDAARDAVKESVRCGVRA